AAAEGAVGRPRARGGGRGGGWGGGAGGGGGVWGGGGGGGGGGRRAARGDLDGGACGLDAVHDAASGRRWACRGRDAANGIIGGRGGGTTPVWRMWRGAGRGVERGGRIRHRT